MKKEEGALAEFLLCDPPQVAQYIMLEDILLEEKAAKWRTPVDRLLNVLEVVVWGGLKLEP